MPRSYFPRIIALLSLILSGLPILLHATKYFNYNGYSNVHYLYNQEDSSWFFLNNFLKKKDKTSAYTRIRKRLFPNQERELDFISYCINKKQDQVLAIVHYKAEDKIIFDAKKNSLILQEMGVLSYDNMQLEANTIALNLNANTIIAAGKKDQQSPYIDNLILTYRDLEKNKYGKDGPTKTRTFFMEKIHYNIDTKRALVDKLLTKQDESIISGKQVKKENDDTFYAEDLIYTTCGLTHPHFYIRAKRIKMVQDKQVTSGPFQFYFDDVPTPLGFVAGTLFLEGKRTHGIIPPDIGEEAINGFYLRNGGYYINFNDYADLSILGSIYSNGTSAFNHKLRYKKRYYYNGNIDYTRNNIGKETGWSFQWIHKTLSHKHKSINVNIDIKNKKYKTLDKEVQKSGNLEHQSIASISYQDKLIGFPYALVIKAKYRENHLNQVRDWRLPEGKLTGSWYPFKMDHFKGKINLLDKIHVKHIIDFESHFKNAKEDPGLKLPAQPILPEVKWNHYTENGVLHTLPITMECKLFTYLNLTPSFSYNERWYWKKLFFEPGEKIPIEIPGFNRVYSWDCSMALHTTLYHTKYFNDTQFLQGFRIKTEPSAILTYTPDFSKEKSAYFQEILNNNGEKEKKYLFEGFFPNKLLANRAQSILSLKVKNTVELKVKKEIDPNETKKQKKNHKIFLLKNLDFETKYDFHAEQFHFTDGIDMHIASEINFLKKGKVEFDLTTKFDPYLSKIITLDDGQIEEKQIPAFAWDNGKYLGNIKNAKWKISIDFESVSDEKKKTETLCSDYSGFTNKLEEKEVNFETPWKFGCEFNWVYNRLNKYKKEQLNYKKEQYITFTSDFTLVKKWKIGIRSSYNFNTKKIDPSNTEICIQRNLHCWNLSYRWHPLGKQAKYDFYLGVKANVLKALKLPRKRSYNNRIT